MQGSALGAPAMDIYNILESTHAYIHARSEEKQSDAKQSAVAPLEQLCRTVTSNSDCERTADSK